jgi:hypothetical protein
MSPCHVFPRGSHLQHRRVCRGRCDGRASMAQAGLAGSRQTLRRRLQHGVSTPARAPRLRESADWVQRRPSGHKDRTNGRAVSTPCASSPRSDGPAVILSSPAVPVSPLAWGHPDTHTGCALVVGDALEPLPRATLGAKMPRGMVHREQVRCRCQRRIRCQREQDAPLGTLGRARIRPAPAPRAGHAEALVSGSSGGRPDMLDGRAGWTRPCSHAC